ncbi:Imm26 family immunity protein [Paeniglutamicibacter sp. MACA_103]|uniref:Imm26 family immunity protein n=1 Tax=Paeniglutamicibacter sp. MACA_103 TaxID=3377337 RepID=UPI003895CD09
MAKAEKISTLKDGDVFSISLRDGTAAVGQVVSSYLASHYVVLFDFVAPEDEVGSRISDALQSKTLFGGLTFDALFRPGRWKILENRAVDSKKYLPAYKTGASDLGNCKVEDFKGKRRRAASDIEAENIPFRKTSAPIIFERAMKAHLGLEPWHTAFDGVRLGDVVTSTELFGY